MPRFRIFNFRTFLYFSKIFFNHFFNCSWTDISRYDHSCIIGTIPLLIKTSNVFQCRILKIFKLSYNGPVVRMSLWIHILNSHIVAMTIGPIINSLSFFVLHNFLLIFKCRLGNGRQKPTHSVGFHP